MREHVPQSVGAGGLRQELKGRRVRAIHKDVALPPETSLIHLWYLYLIKGGLMTFPYKMRTIHNVL